jgi:curved DNA-binding protein
MEYKDYYKTLGVDKKATKDEIKRTYRQLALKFHPDRNPGDKQAEEKFKEINEAYQVLSDPEKRSRYDQLGASYSQWQRTGQSPGSFNWEDWFTPSQGPGGVRVEVGDLEDILGMSGLGGFSEFFRRIFGDFGPRQATGQTYPNSERVNQGSYSRQRPTFEQPVTIGLYEAYKGTTRRIEVNGRKLEIKIPPGSKSNTKIRVAGVISSPNGQKGDLYLIVKVADDPRFERKGNNLYTDKTIDLYTAVLGGETTVQTLSGDILLSIPAGTQSDQTFRLSGRGMPDIKNPDKLGDLFVKISVSIPRELTPRQQELFEELAGLQ